MPKLHISDREVIEEYLSFYPKRPTLDLMSKELSLERCLLQRIFLGQELKYSQYVKFLKVIEEKRANALPTLDQLNYLRKNFFALVDYWQFELTKQDYQALVDAFEWVRRKSRYKVAQSLGHQEQVAS